MVLGYALAVLIGVTLGLLGGGGAVLTVPVLVYVVGLGMREAVPTSLVVVGLTSLLGAVRHARAGNVHLRVALGFAPMAMVGSLAGTRVALLITPRLQLTIFAAVLLAAATLMLRPVRADAGTERPKAPLPAFALLGGGVGFLTGLVGVGGGFLYVPALTLLGRLEIKQAVGTSLVLITLSCLAGVLGYAGRVSLDPWLIGGFVAMAGVGVGLGSALVPHVPAVTLRKAFAIFLLAMGVFVLLRGDGRPRPAPAAPTVSGGTA